MSLANQSLPQREFRLSQNVDKSYTEAELETTRLSATLSYDGAIFDLYGQGDSQKTAQSGMEAPPVPERNARRASRLLDNLGLKLGGAVEPREVSETTPHDFYLSSEEDASSSADDFSDYDYDSASEGPLSPTRRRSHEDTARVVSVIYIGKPSIIDVASLPSRRQSCIETISSVTSVTSRPSTSSTSLSSLNRPSTTSALVPSGFSSKKKPSFLKIDPFANGSTYSLEIPAEPVEAKAPRTPTKLLKGVTRTFSLVRKRSRTLLDSPAAEPATPPPTQNEPAPSPASPVTYNDIIKAARRNSRAASQLLTEPVPQSPVSPASPTGAKKSFLGGLAARRRSIRMVNGRLHTGAP